MPFEERVHGGDQAVQAAGLLDQGAGDEGRPLAEEVHDVQAGGVEQGAVQQLGVPGQAAGGGRGRGPQAAGEGTGAEADGLDVVHVEIAEGVQGVGERVGHGPLLVLGNRPFTRAAAA